VATVLPVAILAAAPCPLAAHQASSPPTVEAGPAAQGPAPELAPILERAGRYVLDYAKNFQDVAADERYTQWTRRADPLPMVTTVVGSVPATRLDVTCSVAESPEDRGGVDLPFSCTRTTRADVVIVRLAGTVPWGLFRDVYEVDGKRVREREPRLERIFASLPPADALPQARGLSEGSDQRYNIGPALWDIGAPTLSLRFLHPKNQSRFAWKLGGKRRFRNVDTVEIEFEEVARPTVGQVGHEDLPASGRLWVDPVQGTLVRSETTFQFEPRRARALVATEYLLEPRLGMWVPGEVGEEYDDLRTGEPPLFGAPTRATAQFSNFRPLSAPTAAGPPVPPTYDAPLTELLQRVGDYVAEYEHAFSDLLAEETYVQRVDAPWTTKNGASVRACSVCKRTTRADLVCVRLNGEIPWVSYRDVFEVDGRKVREHEERLVKLLSKPSADPQKRASTLLAASAAYNIGPVTRTVNLPTLPLLFLLPRNQARFEFRLGGRRMIGATEAVELLFRETSRPTFVQGPWNAELPAQGRFWVNVARAAVVRSETEFAFGPEAQARVTTDYQPEPSLAMWVPAEMTEHFADVPRAKVLTFPARFHGEARYSRFRRFTVSTDEEVALPQP
jgi:hypothetical protein